MISYNYLNNIEPVNPIFGRAFPLIQGKND